MQETPQEAEQLVGKTFTQDWKPLLHGICSDNRGCVSSGQLERTSFLGQGQLDSPARRGSLSAVMCPAFSIGGNSPKHLSGLEESITAHSLSTGSLSMEEGAETSSPISG